jgi:hypothetical protein
MKREKRKMKKEEWGMIFNRVLTDFGKGVIAGLILSAIVFGFVVGFMAHRMKAREMAKYVEKQIEIEALREDYLNRDVDEFLECPDVRRAVDGAAAEFERRRDEAVFRFRNRLAN